MKKITLCLMLILALIIVPGAIFAADDVVEVATYDDLVKAIAGDKNIVLTDTIAIEGEGNVTFDGNGKTISTSTVKNMFEIYSSNEVGINVTFNNVTLKSEISGGICIKTCSEGIVLNINNSTLTTNGGVYDQPLTIAGEETATLPIEVNVNNSSITAKSYYAIIAFNPVNLTITNSNVKGYAAIYMKDNTTGSEINVVDSGLYGINNGSGNSDHFGTVVLEDSGITVNISAKESNSFISATENGTAYEFALMDVVGNNTITVSDTVIEAPRCSLYYKDATKLILGDMTELSDPSIALNLDVLKGFMPKDAIYKNELKDWYTIHEKNTIKVNNPEEGGKIEVIPSSACYGDTVEVKVTVAEGYKLERIFYGGSRIGGMTIDGDELLAEKITFEVPAGKVSMTPIFTELPKAEVSDSVENKEEAEKMVLESLKELIAEDEKLADKIEGKNIDVVIGDPTPITVEKEEKELIEKEAAKKVENLTVAEYMDISIFIVDRDNNDEKIDKISTVKKAIKFTVEVPEEIKTAPKGYTRIFYIVRNHNGMIDVFETEEADGKLSFESDRFSTYAIAYKDVKDEVKEDEKGDTTTGGEGEKEQQPEVKPEDKPVVEDSKEDSDASKDKNDEKVPATGDNVVVYAVFAVVAMAGMAITIKMRRK